MPKIDLAARERSIIEHMLQFSLVWETAVHDVPIVRAFCRKIAETP